MKIRLALALVACRVAISIALPVFAETNLERHPGTGF
jgi:hypothetical protein